MCAHEHSSNAGHGKKLSAASRSTRVRQCQHVGHSAVEHMQLALGVARFGVSLGLECLPQTISWVEVGELATAAVAVEREEAAAGSVVESQQWRWPPRRRR